MIELRDYILASAKSVLNGVTDYSDSCYIARCAGYVAVLITLTAGSNVTITQQISDDDVTFYDPVDTDGTAVGAVYTALLTTKYIQFAPVVGRYVRFKIVAGADSVVTIKLFSKE